MFFYFIIIISPLFSGNTRAADNCLNVKDVTDKFNVNCYSNPYYNAMDENIYYSFNISLPKVSNYSSHIAIIYNQSNPFLYDSILVIVFADCSDPVAKCGVVDIGLFNESFEDENTFLMDGKYRQYPVKENEIAKYYSIDKIERLLFVTRLILGAYDKNYRATYNVFIIPAVKNKTNAEKFLDHFCPIEIKEALYIPNGNYAVLQHTAFYKAKLNKCECSRLQKDDKLTQMGIPVMPVIVGVLMAVVVIAALLVSAVLYHRGMLRTNRSRRRLSSDIIT